MTSLQPTLPEAKRLEAIRLDYLDGMSLADFHRALTQTNDYQVSYAAVRNYHTTRKAPADYYAQVSRVFGIRLEWLLFGEGGMIRQAGQGSPGLPDEEAWIRDLPEIAPTAWVSTDPVAQAAFLDCLRTLDLARPEARSLTQEERVALARVLDTLVAGTLWILRGDREAPGLSIRSLLLALATSLPEAKQGSSCHGILKRMKLETQTTTNSTPTGAP